MSELEEIWNELGNIYFKNEAYDEAVRTYQKAIELNRGSGQSYSNLAYIYARQGRYAEAIPMLRKGIELLHEAGSRAVLWNQLGEAYRKLDDYKNATACYRKAADLDPENTAYQDNLAEAESDDQRLAETQPVRLHAAPQVEAATWIFKNQGLVYPAEQASSAAPKGSPVILGSRILSDTSGQAEPVRNVPKSIESVPPSSRPQGKTFTNANAEGLLRLGIKHWHEHEFQRATQFLETALKTVIRPKDNFLEALCYTALALVKTDLGEIVEAIQAYQSAASLAPERIYPWNTLGNLNCRLNRYDDALAAFREGIEHDPMDTVSWNGLGDVYHKLGRFEDAVNAYQLGNVFEKQFLDEDPLKEFEKSFEASRSNPEVWNEAGNIYFHTGAFEDAIASYKKAIELDPADKTFQANLVRAKKALEQAEAPRQKASLQDLLHPESALVKPAAPAVEEKMTVASEKVAETRTEQNLPQQNSSLSASTSKRESDAPYWVFNPEPILASAAQYTTLGAEKGSDGAGKALPAYSLPAHNQPSYPTDQVRPDADMDDAALIVQMTPRSARPASQLSGYGAQAAFDKPPLPPVVPEKPTADQSPVNQSVLEKDIAAYRKITEINPLNDRAWDCLGNMYESAGLHSEAIKAFEQAIGLSPCKEAYHFHLGMALACQMHYDQAIQALQESLTLNPNFVLAHCALAANYRRIGNDAAVQEHIAIARPSMETEKEYNRACFESISGDADQAFALLETALEKEQCQTAMLRSDPDLDFIRNDERFEAILYKSMSVTV
jgi:tetratricopeptide (TPR) repeat protein